MINQESHEEPGKDDQEVEANPNSNSESLSKPPNL